MRRVALCTLCIALTPLAASAQATSSPSPATPASTIHASARLVVVDVTVTDGHGNPVKGLKPSDFHLLEDKKPQKVRSFEEHAGVSERSAGSSTPAMQPGVFTNTVAATDSPVNILLLDMLNTPTQSQAFVHDQLVKYLNAAKPGTRIAVFALTDRLIMLQGLTTDLTALRVAVARSHPQRSFRADPANNTTGAEGALVAPIEAQFAEVSPLMADALDVPLSSIPQPSSAMP
jgi:VWFA-related protein